MILIKLMMSVRIHIDVPNPAKVAECTMVKEIKGEIKKTK
jgi:hypothetical protein